MSSLTPAQRVREALTVAAHGPRKSLSQHFLVDPNILERIAEATGVGAGDRVLEIGPGPGVLTTLLLDRGAQVTAIEIDGGLAEYVRGVFTDAPFKVIVADALAVDLPGLMKGCAAWTIASNLPYAISTPLLYRLPEVVGSVRRVVLTLQREVAERVCADPGHPARGAVSAMVKRCFAARILRRIPSAAFLPPPRVESALLELTPSSPLAREATDESYRTVVRAAFGVRRKVLAKALTTGPDALSREEAESVIKAACLTGRERAEQLSEQEFELMAQELDRTRGMSC